MAYTTLTAAQVGIADGDTSPQPIDGTIRITPRFPAAGTPSGFIATGPIIVTVTGGAIPRTEVPAQEDATALIEFHLYDRNAGPIRLPNTEIPLEPNATINLRDYLPAGVDPATGQAIVRGPRGRGITSVTGVDGKIVIEWEGGGAPATIPVPEAVPGPPGDKGDPGDVRFEGVNPGITVRTDDVLIGDTTVPSLGFINDTKFANPANVSLGTNWDDLAPDRVHKITENLSAASAAAQNAPGDGRWVVFVLDNLNALRIQFAFRVTLIPRYARITYRSRTANGWGAWGDISVDADTVNALTARVEALESTPEAEPPARPSSGFKVVGVPATVGHSGSDAPLSGTYRIPFDWVSPSVPVSRMKVRIRNINIRNGATRAGQISLDGIWMGVPDAAGHFAATPTQIAPAVTFDGAEGYESPWVDVPGGTLNDKAISYAYTATSAPWAQLCTGFYEGGQAGGSTGNIGMGSSFTAAFTIDLIVETYATTPVLAVVGDSNSVGIGARNISHSWGALLGSRLHALPQLFGSSGDTAESSTDPEAFKLNRFPDCAPADSVLFALGANDAGGSRSISQIEGYVEASVSNARHLGGRIYGVAANPRTGESNPDYEDRRRAISAWLAEHRWGLHGYVDFTSVISADDETLRPEFDADGTHINMEGNEAIADHVAATYRVTSPAVQYVT